ncbi:carbohydrate kinase [Bacillus marinisedimentorum]|uniref:carbohydrate kinase n=1 Tax=Bacillus marinisedimentorum TaxID=1821260 RepID=UPI000872087E|nr:carbohydrate kinase [Bacillus marinisedimentorum]
MNENEKKILSMIKDNPFVTQHQLSKQLGLSRSAVAGYISNLMKKGEIIGRAYVPKEERLITCIGGSNVDRKSWIHGDIQWGTSNPVTSKKAKGGVARNVAENLGRLGMPVSLLTVVGEDPDGEWLLDSSKEHMDISPSYSIHEAATGSYTALLDESGDMIVALADMGIYDRIEDSDIDRRWNILAASSFVMIDTNFSSEVISHVIKRCGQSNVPLCVAPVSAPKVKKLPHRLEGITLLAANRDEIEAMTGITLENEEDFKKAAASLFSRGVENVVITFGKKGLFYFDRSASYGRLQAPSLKKIREVTGAGDALVAGILYGLNRHMDLGEACRYGMACSIHSLQTEDTVSRDLNELSLQETYQYYFGGIKP